MTEIKTLDGGFKVLDAECIDELEDTLRGSVSHPKSAEYDTARTIWNAMVDRSPGLGPKAIRRHETLLHG